MTKRLNKKLTIKITAASLLLIFLLIVPQFVVHDPYETNLSLALKPPGTNGYLLGTDSVGRCMLCRILTGGRISIFSAFAVIGIVFTAGTALGVVSGYLGGKTDIVINKITVIFQAFPGFVLAVAVAGILGPGLVNGIISLSLVYWTTYCRLSRSLVLNIKEAAYIRAAKMCGAKKRHIILKYIIPNMISQMIITAALDIGNVILSMAGLSFIGLGASRPTAEWGAMMSESRTYLQTAPWTIVFPGIALFVSVLIFNMLGDAIRDFMDKKTDKRKEVII